MPTRLIRAGACRCQLPPAGGYGHGAIVECIDCGRQWKAKHPGNPAYSGWYRRWFSRRREPAGGA